MANPWDPELDVTCVQAAALIAAHFPELADEPVHPFGAGWDNVAIRVGVGAADLLFRFPRKAMAADFLRTEILFLPGLARVLPLPITAPTRVVLSADASVGGYPFPFAGYPLLPGTTVCSADLTIADRAALAVPIANFLAALHAIVPPEGFPDDRLSKSDLPLRAGRLKAWLPRVPELDPVDVGAILDDLAQTPAWPHPPCVVHGDLYARHLLVDADKQLTGVIDWGDMHAGDPALDLSIAYTLLPTSAHAAFRDAYGGIDEATWLRVRFTAWRYALYLLAFGRDTNDAGMSRIAGWTLETLTGATGPRSI